MSERLTLVAAILAVPWTVLGGLMWWNPARRTGSSPWLRRSVYRRDHPGARAIVAGHRDLAQAIGDEALAMGVNVIA